MRYLPGADALKRGQVPDSDLAGVAGGEEEAVVGAESQGGEGFRVGIEGGAYGGSGWIDDLDGLAAGAGDEGGVRWDDEGAAGVELLQSGDAAVVGLQSEGFHWETAAPVIRRQLLRVYGLRSRVLFCFQFFYENEDFFSIYLFF